MQTYAAKRYPPGYEFETSTLFWGALIFVAFFASCLLAWKAIEWLRNRNKASAPGRATTTAGPGRRLTQAPIHPLSRDNTSGTPGTPRNPYDVTSAPSWARYADEGSAMGGMNEREEEEFFLAFGTRKHRKAIKERRKAPERAEKHSKSEFR